MQGILTTPAAAQSTGHPTLGAPSQGLTEPASRTAPLKPHLGAAGRRQHLRPTTPTSIMAPGHKVWDCGHTGAVGCRKGLELNLADVSGALRTAGGDMGGWPELVWWRLSPVAQDGMRSGEGKLKGRCFAARCQRGSS